MKHFEVVTYYRDIEIEDGETYGVGDYYYLVVKDADTGEIVVRYGDCYHDKGQEKLQGFFDGLKYSGVAFFKTERNAKAGEE